MKKQKRTFRCFRYDGVVLYAKREIPYEIKLYSKLILDELCFNSNKSMLESAINRSIDEGNEEDFLKLSKQYKRYLMEETVEN